MPSWEFALPVPVSLPYSRQLCAPPALLCTGVRTVPGGGGALGGPDGASRTRRMKNPSRFRCVRAKKLSFVGDRRACLIYRFAPPPPPYPRQPPSAPSIRLRSFRTYLTVLRDTWVSFLRIARSFTQEFTRFSFREFREPQPPFDPLGPLERRGGIVPSRRFCAFDVTALILLTCGFLLFICLF